MPITITGVSRSLRDLDTDQQKFIEVQLRTRALQAFADVRLATPVDTGRARNSWVIGYNVSYNRDGTAGVEVLTQRERPTEIHVTNGVPYIEDLNDGSSVQAPTKFIEEAYSRYFDEVRITVINDGNTSEDEN